MPDEAHIVIEGKPRQVSLWSSTKFKSDFDLTLIVEQIFVSYNNTFRIAGGTRRILQHGHCFCVDSRPLPGPTTLPLWRISCYPTQMFEVSILVKWLLARFCDR